MKIFYKKCKYDNQSEDISVNPWRRNKPCEVLIKIISIIRIIKHVILFEVNSLILVENY